MINESVGIGELKIISGEGTLVAYALGSCIALCLYDPVLMNGSMAHILLPGRRKNPRDEERPATYYADTAVLAALKVMENAGSRRDNIVAAMVGGAKMFPHGDCASVNIGQRNIEAVTAQLDRFSIPLQYSSVGGTRACTVRFSIPGEQLSQLLTIKR